MRQTLMLATMAVLTACGHSGDLPWDENHDGLITACEGLNPQACDATAGCEPAAMVCDTLCRDDGHGGCLPCVGAETCRPTPPPPTFNCTQLSEAQCVNDVRCELVQAQSANATDRASGAEFAPPAPRPPGPRVCVARHVTCESLTSDLCLARPGCALIGVNSFCDFSCDPTTSACTICAAETGSGAPLPDVAPAQQTRCITLPPLTFCESRDANTCTLDGRCVLESGPVCDVVCEPGGECPPCAHPSSRCVAPRPLDVCEARDVNSCTLDGQCVIESGPVCDAACDPDGSCPPCANPSFRCVHPSPPDVCGARDLNSCAIDGRCVVQAWACPAICKPDGHGGCEPCDAPPVACVPAPQPIDECASRDLSSCTSDGQCELQAWACAAICIPDGNGGCEPCAAPPVACVPSQNKCAGLDRATCGLVGCEVIELACTAECRDDGQGGCLPCDAFLCTDGSGGGGSGPGDVDGGTPPPAP